MIKAKKFKILSLVMTLALIFSSFVGMGPVQIVKADTTTPVTIAAWNYTAAPGSAIVPATTDILSSGAVLENFAGKIPTYSSTSLCIGNGNGDWSNGANTKYWQITLSTLGYENLTLAVKTRSSGTGPRDFKVVYSTDGNTWNDIPGGAYAITSSTLKDFMPAPLSLPTNAANVSNLELRFIMTSNISSRAGTSTYSPIETVASGGTSNINNIIVAGTPIGTTSTPINVTGVSLDKNTLSLGIGQTAPLTATIAPANATNKIVAWSSDNNNVATVVNGVVTAVSEGTSTITVTTDDGGFKSLCVVTVNANAPPTSKIFDIVEITDFHGQLLDSTNTKQVGAALAYVVKGVKAANPDRTLIIGGGDLYQGTPTSNVLYGVPVQQVMSNIGMEATALGNHEFDWGLRTIINKTMVGANYEIVCANMYNKGTNTRPFSPYKIITKDGVRIAVIGAILKDAPTIILPANVADYDFRDVATEVNAAAKEIRDRNLADIVLATIHDGGTSLNAIVNNLQGVDAVFGGHDHTAADTVNVDATGKNVPTLDASSTGKGYIDLKITLDSANKITAFSNKGSNWKTLTVTTTSPTDSECKKIVDDASAALLPIFNEIIGHDDAAYTKDQKDSPYGESELGNWMADVVKNYANAEVGMVNNGGIRLSPISAGDITVGTIFNLMPFDNTVCTTTMTGEQLKFILEQAVQDNGKGIQISGVKFKYDSSKPSYKPAVVAADGTVTSPEVPGQRVFSIVRESDGSTVKDTDTIKVAAPDFVATGGDTFTGFLAPSIVASFVDSHYTVRDALIADVRAKGKITVVLNNRVDSQTAVVDPVAMSIAEARTTSLKAVILTGTVSAVNGNNVFMQDDTAGICVYNSGGKTFSAKKGDKITVTGILSTYSGLLEVTPASADNVVLLSAGNTVTPKVVTVNAATNAIQGQLVKIENLIIDSINNGGATMAHDATGSINIFKMPVVNGLKVGDVADVTAAVTCYGTAIELAVDSAADVVVDRTAPVITISSIDDGKIYKTNITPVITTDDSTATVTSTLNGQPYNGGQITAEGIYVLTVTASDLGKNTSTKTVSFTIDKTAPEITVSSVEEGKLYNTNIMPIITVDDAAATVTEMLNGKAYYDEEITDEGSYILEVAATDLAGNESDKSVTFTIDKTAPVITVTGVEDNKFYRTDITPIIDVVEVNKGTLAVTLDGEVYNGGAITSEGNHQLTVTAVDEAGNNSNVAINFIIDKTAPLITSNIFEGSSFERIDTFTITNIAEDDNSGLDTLETILDGAAISNNEVLNLETLAFGSHQMLVTAKDRAGNTSVVEVNFTITATINTLSNLLEKFYNQGLIKNAGLYNSLATKLSKGNLTSFANEILAQNGKGLDKSTVNTLMDYVNWINTK